MTEDSLFAALPELRQEVRQLREQHALIAERVAKLEAVIVAIEALHAPAKPLGPKAATLAQPAVPAAQLKGIPAVRRVMRELPGRIWRPRELHHELERRGWISPHAKHPAAGTESAVNRLWRSGEIERVGPGQYRYGGKEEPEER